MSNGEKKGMSPVAWVAIGCGGCLLVVLLVMGACGGLAWFKFGDAISEFKDNPAKGAAMMVVEANPELELVSADDQAGTLTIRNTTTGEEITLDWEEISEGRFRVETSEGEVTIDASGENGTMTISGDGGETTTVIGGGAELADWLPVYPGADDVESVYAARDDRASGGAYTFTTGDGLDEVIAWYAEAFDEDDWRETSRFVQQGRMANVSFAKGERTVTVAAVPADDQAGSRVTVQYADEP